MDIKPLTKHEQLNIGAGAAPDSRMLNADLHPGPDIDLVFDAEKEWPVEPESFTQITCSHVLEHLRDHIGFFSHAYRAMKMGGRLFIRVPYGWNQAAWWDPTHVRPWTHDSFAFVQPGYSKYTRNLVQAEFDFAFWIVSTTLVCARDWARLHRLKFRPWNRLVHRVSRHVINAYGEVFVDLRKTTLDDPKSKAFGGDMDPVVTPFQIAAYKQDMNGQPPVKTGEYCELVVVQ